MTFPTLVTEPCDPVMLVTIAPAGKRFVRQTPVAGAGPLFHTIDVNVIGELIIAEVALHVAVSASSALSSCGNSGGLKINNSSSEVRKASKPEPHETKLAGAPTTPGMTNDQAGSNVLMSNAVRIWFVPLIVVTKYTSPALTSGGTSPTIGYWAERTRLSASATRPMSENKWPAA